jgi:hypothetical protein
MIKIFLECPPQDNKSIRMLMKLSSTITFDLDVKNEGQLVFVAS